MESYIISKTDSSNLTLILEVSVKYYCKDLNYQQSMRIATEEHAAKLKEVFSGKNPDNVLVLNDNIDTTHMVKSLKKDNINDDSLINEKLTNLNNKSDNLNEINEVVDDTKENSMGDEKLIDSDVWKVNNSDLITVESSVVSSD